MVRVLVFDESALVGKLVEHYLSKHGWVVESHNNGESFCDIIYNFAPNVVLLDPTTPGLTAEGLVHALRENKAAINYKLICLSCDSGCSETRMAHEGILDGYFIKRYTLDGLKDVIQEVLDAH